MTSSGLQRGWRSRLRGSATDRRTPRAHARVPASGSYIDIGFSIPVLVAIGSGSQNTGASTQGRPLSPCLDPMSNQSRQTSRTWHPRVSTMSYPTLSPQSSLHNPRTWFPDPTPQSEQANRYLEAGILVPPEGAPAHGLQVLITMSQGLRFRVQPILNPTLQTLPPTLASEQPEPGGWRLRVSRGGARAWPAGT